MPNSFSLAPKIWFRAQAVFAVLVLIEALLAGTVLDTLCTAVFALVGGLPLLAVTATVLGWLQHRSPVSPNLLQGLLHGVAASPLLVVRCWLAPGAAIDGAPGRPLLPGSRLDCRSGFCPQLPDRAAPLVL